MQILKDTVQDVIKNLKLKQSEEEVEVLRLLKKSLTRQERLHVNSASLRRGIVTIDVDSSAWLYQLNQKKERLVEQLGVKDIRLRIGEVKRNEKEKGH